MDKRDHLLDLLRSQRVNGFNGKKALTLVFVEAKEEQMLWKIGCREKCGIGSCNSFAALEPVELTEKIQAVGANGDNPKPEKKMKKKRGDAVDMSGLLEIWVGDFLSLFDLKDPEFDVFLSEIKDFIESTEEGRKKAFSVIEEVSERHCATALATPAFEWRETLMGEYGEGSKLIDELADQGAKLFSLRYHSSVSFARYVVDIGLTFFKAC
ncbi:hypothetical protein K1719_035855 [Acacia pycnantha]|nr:hypothetical protein K1719_035855 [Acacia pycnantha]